MSKKIFLIIGVLILLVGIPAAILLLKQPTIFKLGAQTNEAPTGIQTIEIGPQEATITWVTQKPSQGVISYGISPNNLTLLQPETTPAINHRVKLTSLLPETTYFFVIKIGDKSFDNSGQPFTFTTKPKEKPLPTSTPQLSPSPSSLHLPLPSPSPSYSFTENEIEKALGTNNPTYDLNKDGIVNTLDLLLFQQQQSK
jgi:hypothetical protein